MIWKKVKRLIIPLMIIKLSIFLFFLFKSERISISRDINYNTVYQEEFDDDTLVQKRQKFIRIVRNENEPGILIKLREKKTNRSEEKKEGIITPIVD